MKVIGITGTSGSGKSTISEIFKKYDNVKVIDADQVARNLSMPGTKYYNAIKSSFGEEIFLLDGTINRKVLANKIYTDENAKNKLNSLTFKYVVDEIIFQIQHINDANIDIVVIDAPLLFESGLNKICNIVVAMISDKQLKIKRICLRDKIDVETAKNRLKIQNEDFYYTEKSDFVIDNSENCNLENEVKNILLILEEKK